MKKKKKFSYRDQARKWVVGALVKLLYSGQLWLSNLDLRSSVGMQSFTFSLQVLLIKEALCKKHFSPVLINQINKNKTFCQAICCCSYPSTGLKKKKKRLPFSVLFSIPLLRKTKQKSQRKTEREIKQLSKQINPTFPRAHDLRQCQFRLFPPFFL